MPVLCSSKTLIIPLAEEAVKEWRRVVGIATNKPKVYNGEDNDNGKENIRIYWQTPS